jgi:hypothetical protein
MDETVNAGVPVRTHGRFGAGFMTSPKEHAISKPLEYTETAPEFSPHLLLERLIESSVIHGDDWKSLAAASREALKQGNEVEALLSSLVELGLLTHYQAERVGNGEAFGLVVGNCC